MTSPCTNCTQKPLTPVATTPASNEPMMYDPKNVPTIKPTPPAMEVPPMKTAAMTGRSMPCPWVG